MIVLSDIQRKFLVGASPSGKAPAFDAGIRRFDPCRPSQGMNRSFFNAIATFGWLNICQLL
jgi:hypothetical protein